MEKRKIEGRHYDNRRLVGYFSEEDRTKSMLRFEYALIRAIHERPSCHDSSYEKFADLEKKYAEYVVKDEENDEEKPFPFTEDRKLYNSGAAYLLLYYYEISKIAKHPRKSLAFVFRHIATYTPLKFISLAMHFGKYLVSYGSCLDRLLDEFVENVENEESVDKTIHELFVRTRQIFGDWQAKWDEKYMGNVEYGKYVRFHDKSTKFLKGLGDKVAKLKSDYSRKRFVLTLERAKKGKAWNRTYNRLTHDLKKKYSRKIEETRKKWNEKEQARPLMFALTTMITSIPEKLFLHEANLNRKYFSRRGLNLEITSVMYDGSHGYCAVVDYFKVDPNIVPKFHIDIKSFENRHGQFRSAVVQHDVRAYEVFDFLAVNGGIPAVPATKIYKKNYKPDIVKREVLVDVRRQGDDYFAVLALLDNDGFPVRIYSKPLEWMVGVETAKHVRKLAEHTDFTLEQKEYEEAAEKAWTPGRLHYGFDDLDIYVLENMPGVGKTSSCVLPCMVGLDPYRPAYEMTQYVTERRSTFDQKEIDLFSCPILKGHIQEAPIVLFGKYFQGNNKLLFRRIIRDAIMLDMALFGEDAIKHYEGLAGCNKRWLDQVSRYHIKNSGNPLSRIFYRTRPSPDSRHGTWKRMEKKYHGSKNVENRSELADRIRRVSFRKITPVRKDLANIIAKKYTPDNLIELLSEYRSVEPHWKALIIAAMEISATSKAATVSDEIILRLGVFNCLYNYCFSPNYYSPVSGFDGTWTYPIVWQQLTVMGVHNTAAETMGKSVHHTKDILGKYNFKRVTVLSTMRSLEYNQKKYLETMENLNEFLEEYFRERTMDLRAPNFSVEDEILHVDESPYHEKNPGVHITILDDTRPFQNVSVVEHALMEKCIRESMLEALEELEGGRLKARAIELFAHGEVMENASRMFGNFDGITTLMNQPHTKMVIERMKSKKGDRRYACMTYVDILGMIRRSGIEKVMLVGTNVLSTYGWRSYMDAEGCDPSVHRISPMDVEDAKERISKKTVVDIIVMKGESSGKIHTSSNHECYRAVIDWLKECGGLLIANDSTRKLFPEVDSINFAQAATNCYSDVKNVVVLGCTIPHPLKAKAMKHFTGLSSPSQMLVYDTLLQSITRTALRVPGSKVKIVIQEGNLSKLLGILESYRREGRNIEINLGWLNGEQTPGITKMKTLRASTFEGDMVRRMSEVIKRDCMVEGSVTVRVVSRDVVRKWLGRDKERATCELISTSISVRKIVQFTSLLRTLKSRGNREELLRIRSNSSGPDRTRAEKALSMLDYIRARSIARSKALVRYGGG